MEPIVTLIASALGRGLAEVAKGLWETGRVDVPLEPAKKGLERFAARQYHERIGADRALRDAVQTALAEAGAPTDDEDDLRRWLQNVSLDRLMARQNHALRRQMARAVLAFTDPRADPQPSSSTWKLITDDDMTTNQRDETNSIR